MAKRSIITIHGVNSTGAWQEGISRVLAPHFQCFHWKYTDFPRPLGKIRACIGLRVAALTFGTTVSAMSWLLNAPIWGCVAGVPFALFFGVVWARTRRREVGKRFEKWFGEATIGRSGRPHLIAHSFGTFVFGNAVLRQPTARSDRVILVGCVLPRSFSWENVVSVGPRQVGSVRNEVAGRDRVSRIAGILSFITGLGDSGSRGFDCTNHVHTIAGPWQRCVVCSKDNTALVHNVVLDQFGHSDMFLSIRHVEELWLPFLWDITPDEYDDFRIYCDTAASLQAEHNFKDLAMVEAELRERNWSWTRLPDGTEASFEDFVDNYTWEFLEDVLQSNGISLTNARKTKMVNSIVDRAFPLIWKGVVEAIEETGKMDPAPHRISALHPKTAATKAIKSLFYPFA